LRTPRRVRWLPAREVLLPRARRVLADIAALEQGLRDVVDRLE
jgi:DNA-binding transcriptional LysR family regulator